MANNSKTFKLEDGRKLGYIEYGDLKGKPLFFFHGWPGSRYSGKETDVAAKKLGIKIISTDRPGMGLSDFKANRKLLDWPDDVVELADYLKIRAFSVLGVSGGGPYVAACCYKIPKRISQAGIVVGLAPVDVKGNLDGVAWRGRIGWANYHRFPFSRTIAAFISGVLFKYLPILGNLAFQAPQDKEIYKNIKNGLGTENSANEAFAQGIKGPTEELRIYTDDWGFDLRKIKSRVFLWYGAKDKQVSLNQGKYYHSQIPNSKLYIDQNASHLSRYNYEDKILKTLID